MGFLFDQSEPFFLSVYALLFVVAVVASARLRRSGRDDEGGDVGVLEPGDLDFLAGRRGRSGGPTPRARIEARLVAAGLWRAAGEVLEARVYTAFAFAAVMGIGVFKVALEVERGRSAAWLLTGIVGTLAVAVAMVVGVPRRTRKGELALERARGR